MYFSYDHSNPFNGIINFWRVNYNEQFKNLLSVEASSIVSAPCKARYAIDNTSNYWIALEGDQSYIKFVLPSPILAEGYLIKTSNNRPNSCHPKTWVMESSLDGVQNILSQEYSDENQLNNNNAFKYFTMEKGLYQIFIIKPLTSYASNCVNRFDLNEFELYGTLLLNRKLTCKQHNNYIKQLHLISLLIITIK